MKQSFRVIVDTTEDGENALLYFIYGPVLFGILEEFLAQVRTELKYKLEPNRDIGHWREQLWALIKESEARGLFP